MKNLNTNLQILIFFSNFLIIGLIAYNEDNSKPAQHEERVQILTGQNIPPNVKDAMGAIINLNGYSCKEVLKLEKHENYNVSQCLNDQTIISYQIDNNGSVTIQ
jgi:hypothetical protein